MGKGNFSIDKRKIQDACPCTKLVVPSKGSTIQVGSSVNSVAPQAAVVSSPMNLD